MKAILTLGNFEDQFGGIKWYVDQLLGSGHDKEEFYTNSQAKDAYRNYVSQLVYRTNSINGIQYKDDTTILSWELLVSPCFQAKLQFTRQIKCCISHNVSGAESG